MFDYSYFAKIGDCFVDLAAHGDETASFGAYLLEKTLNSAFDYVRTRNAHKTCVLVDRGVIHPLEYQDKLRSFIHDEKVELDVVVGNLRILQPLFGDYISGSIFTGDINNTKDIVAFCGEVSRVIFDTEVEGV